MTARPEQDALFSEDFYDALKDVVRVLGGTKAVGKLLRPELVTDAAGDWLKDCLNPKNRHTLDPQQVLWLLREGRRVGCHSGVNFIADDCGYARPTPLEPLDEAAELQRRAEMLTKELRSLVGRMERVGAPIKAVA